MSKYAGSITIRDDEGNSVFERELDYDEIIETLLAGYPDAEEEEEVAPPPRPQTKKSEKKLGGKEGKPCCGSKQNRHKKTCRELSDDAPSPSAPASTGNGGRGVPFSEETFNTVKKMLQKESQSAVVAEKGFDRDEVRRISEASNYDEYSRMP